MLLDGFNHVAILTMDTDRFTTFYRDVFDAELTHSIDMDGQGHLSFVRRSRRFAGA
jgi:catechol 2,3-dioxygenase-like lactoylglutathione lyase family enzyme